MILNRDVFAVDPLQSDIPNNGVASVADPRTVQELQTLKYELRSFVCEGEYVNGLERILNAYLAHVDDPEQPAVWVSGFYGSGKSHLVKVLRYLWMDYHFEDGASAHGPVTLPTAISDALKELSTVARRAGGVNAAAGTLGSGIGNIRLALLAIIFRSIGLPEEYPIARFVLWMQDNGYYEPVRQAIESSGKDFAKELRNMYVSPVLARALLQTAPGFAGNEAEARSLLKAQYPNVSDISINQMLDAVYDALTVDGKIPCTLIALDEVQQFIGDDADRSYDVQEFQTAMTGFTTDQRAALVLSAVSALWLVVAVYFLGDISAHFNPAMTLAFALRRDMG
jgi:hypothetical protein